MGIVSLAMPRPKLGKRMPAMGRKNNTAVGSDAHITDVN